MEELVNKKGGVVPHVNVNILLRQVVVCSRPFQLHGH